MGNDKARATDRLSVGVVAPLADGGAGTTNWRIERWNQEQVARAMRGLRNLGIEVPSTGARQHGGRPVPVGLRPATFGRFGIEPYEVSEFTGNLITNAGWTRLMNLLTAQGATQAMDATHTRIGVGDGTTPAEAYADTDLAAVAGTTHRWFQLVSGAGSLGTRTLAWSATFGTADGNFAWNEMGLDLGTASGNTVTAPLFNHKVGVAQGTKAAGQVWTATATISFT